MIMTDGSPDTVSITVQRKSSVGGVWFASAWNPLTGRSNEKPLVPTSPSNPATVGNVIMTP